MHIRHFCGNRGDILLVLITYDVNTENEAGKSRLRKVAKQCVNYGVRVQNSVFECILDNAQCIALKSMLTDIIDEKTVEIVLKEGNTDFLPYLTAAIIPAANEDPESNPIGTGPYKYVSRSPQENVILEKFDEYWGTPANIDTVKLQVIANADTIVTSLNGGSVDMFARISQAQADQLSDDFDVLEGTMNLVQAMYLNNAKEPFNDVRVRQALCYAVDPQGIMDMISDGKGTQIGSSMFPSFGKYYMEELNDLYATNIEKAKELLTEAGYPDGFSFTLTVPSNYQQHVDTAQVIAEQLKEIGVTANIQLIEWESWLSDVYSDRNYEATVVGVDASSLTAAALLSRFESTASNNFKFNKQKQRQNFFDYG